MICGLIVSAISARAEAAPAIDVYTMGPGEHVFSHFGHSAICVSEASAPQGICYNYGTADFSTPVPLTIEFIRGRALFWVSVIDRRRMIEAYRREDRTVWRQRLPLSDDQAEQLARDLAQAVRSAERYYRYHHYDDNCTTRIRDVIDRVTGGALTQAAAKTGPHPTLRAYSMRGFAGRIPLLIVSDLVLGRVADRPIGEWEAMFLPEVLMGALEKHLGATPQVEYQRQAPVFTGSEHAGRWALFFGAVILALPGLVLGRRAGGRPRSVRIVAGLVLGLLALLPWTLALTSAFAELRINEVLLVLLPSDLLLGALSERAARRYVVFRLGGLAIVAILLLAGVLIQPLWTLLACAALVLGSLAYGSAR